jgi:hypothetical protein
MRDTNSGRMNHFIPPHMDDTVYFYARKIVRRLPSNWYIHVAPAACRVSMKNQGEGFPTVEDLRQNVPQRITEPGKVIYEGRVLFSGGIILTINDKILMLQRDRDAPVDPLKWTSPAGRCDREPLLTALKEFYEEVILFDKVLGKPIFVTFGNVAYFEQLKEIYGETVKRKGFEYPSNEWIFVYADVESKDEAYLQEVQTCFGPDETSDTFSEQEVFTGRFFTFFDEEGNTLEMRLLASLLIAAETEANMAFRDGEYERTVKLFTKEEFMFMKESALVRTISYFRKQVLQDGKEYNAASHRVLD